MPTKSAKNESQSAKTAREKAFEYQLQTLTLEMQYIERSIARLDEITQTTKYWAILIWSGSLSLILGQQSLRQYTIFATVIPFLFWIIDARWRYWLGYFSYRQGKISEFINSDALQKAFEAQSLLGFTVLDPLGKVYQKTPEFKKKRTLSRALRSTEVLPFYIGMMIISLSIGTFFFLNPTP